MTPPQSLDKLLTPADRVALATVVLELTFLLDAPERIRLNELVIRYMAAPFYGELDEGAEDFLVGMENYFDTLLLAWQTMEPEEVWRLRPRTRPRLLSNALLSVN
jgi:hypothetical protein